MVTTEGEREIREARFHARERPTMGDWTGTKHLLDDLKQGS